MSIEEHLKNIDALLLAGETTKAIPSGLAAALRAEVAALHEAHRASWNSLKNSLLLVTDACVKNERQLKDQIDTTRSRTLEQARIAGAN